MGAVMIIAIMQRMVAMEWRWLHLPRRSFLGKVAYGSGMTLRREGSTRSKGTANMGAVGVVMWTAGRVLVALADRVRAAPSGESSHMDILVIGRGMRDTRVAHG